MLVDNSNISARVPDAIKLIVNESEYSHKDAYMIGAGLIAIGKAEETKTLLDNNPDYEKKIKSKEYQIIKDKKNRLEKELRDL